MTAIARLHSAIVLLASQQSSLNHPRAPHIDYAAISPFEALLGGSVIVLLVGLLRSRFAREQLVPALTLLTLAVTIAVTVWQWNDHISAISGAKTRSAPSASAKAASLASVRG